MAAIHTHFGGNYSAFVNALAAPKLSHRQAAVISRVWSKITGTESTTGAKFVASFASEELGKSLLDNFPGTSNGKDGLITWADFDSYYRQVAALIPEDNYFEEFIGGQFGENHAETTDKITKSHVMHLIALMRQRLLTLAGHSQEEFALRGMFREFDLNNNGAMSIDELGGLTSKLGVSCTEDELVAMFRELDMNGNGMIEFEEFQSLMISDPYTKFDLIKE